MTKPLQPSSHPPNAVTPRSPFTEYCGHIYRLVQRLRGFVVGPVTTAIDEAVKSHPEASRRRDNAVQVTFVRIVRWLKTLDKLNQTHDVQAVGAAARGIFEHYLDLKWFEKFPQPEYIERLCAHPDVIMYLAAKKVVDHKVQNPSSVVDSIRSKRSWIDATQSSQWLLR